MHLETLDIDVFQGMKFLKKSQILGLSLMWFASQNENVGIFLRRQKKYYKTPSETYMHVQICRFVYDEH